MSNKPSCRVTIFEGPDGGGKSTLGQQYADITGARYVHMGPFKGVKNIARFYADAMMPAVLGYQDVVMDRCWISEPIYGAAFRKGEDRVGPANARALSRLALRCGGAVVYCMPHRDVAANTFSHRPEMLSTIEEFDTVYSFYSDAARTPTMHLPFLEHDYKKDSKHLLFDALKDTSWRETFLARSGYVGSRDAKILIVGESFSDHTDKSAFYQWPFGGFTGSSHWLNTQLETASIREHNLMWVNADQPSIMEDWIDLGRPNYIFALGKEAYSRVNAFKANATIVQLQHPSFCMRFARDERYPLIDHLIKLECHR